MGSLEFAYTLLALNPFGGPFVAIPLAMWKLQWSAALAISLTATLAFTQVWAVELGWGSLVRWPRFVAYVESRRSERLQARLGSRWALLWIALVSPWVGPWLVAALARFSGAPFRRVAPALFAGLLYVCALTAILCLFAPEWLPADARAYLE